jgi:cation:H+ antiporter
VPIVAIISGVLGGTAVSQAQGHSIGIGAILGAPFLLSTLAMGVSAAAVYYYHWRGKRDDELHIDRRLFLRDFQYFFSAYAIVILASFIPIAPVKWLLALSLLGLYGFYVYKTLTAPTEHVPEEEVSLDPLTFQPTRLEPATSMILLQILVSLGGIIFLAHLFVHQIQHLSHVFGIDSLVLSLIITPIATELPEKFNSVVWIGKQKDNLALANITGAMVFQGCIPTAVGIVFTPWVLDFQSMFTIGLCFASSFVLYASIRQAKGKTPSLPFLLGGFFYLIFIGYVIYNVWMGAPAK